MSQGCQRVKSSCFKLLPTCHNESQNPVDSSSQTSSPCCKSCNFLKRPFWTRSASYTTMYHSTRIGESQSKIYFTSRVHSIHYCRCNMIYGMVQVSSFWSFLSFIHNTETLSSDQLSHLSRFRGALRMILSTLRRSYTKSISICT